MIKLIALDLDDTLLMPDCSIPGDVIALLQDAIKKGIYVVIATGRIFPSAKIYAEMIGADCPIVCYNGSMLRKINEVPLYIREIDVGLIRRIAEFCKGKGLYLQMYNEDNIVVEKICEKTLIDPDAKVTGIREIGDLTNAALYPTPKMMIVDEPDKIRQIRLSMEKLFGDELYMAKSKEYLLEMMPKGVSKKNTLSLFTESAGINRDEVMVCGDNTNDIEMVKWAGIGVAVSNAVPELKAAADYISDNERSYGVADAVRRFAL